MAVAAATSQPSATARPRCLAGPQPRGPGPPRERRPGRASVPRRAPSLTSAPCISRAHGGPSRPTTSCAATASGSRSTTAAGPRSASPVTGATTRSSPPATVRSCYRTAFDAAAAGAGPTPLGHARRHLLPGRRVARRRLPRRSRGLLLPAHLRHHGAGAARRRARARRRGDVRARSAGTDGRRNITGVFQHSEAVDRDWNPGGLWRPVRIYDTGPVRIDRLRVLCRDADEARAHLRLHARLDSDDAAAPSACARSSTARSSAETEHSLARGHNEVDWTLDIDDPALWWPWSLGDQPLTDDRRRGARRRRDQRPRVTCAPACARWRCTTGCCSVNGERLFLKGANLLPDRPGPRRRHAGRRPPRRRARRRGRARPAAGARPTSPRAELYDAADELGMLLLAGLPAAVGLRPQRPPAGGAPGPRGGRPARPPPVDRACGAPTTSRSPTPPQSTATAVAAGSPVPRRQQLPSWNKTILDRWVKRAFEQADPTRPTVAHSGVLPHLPQLDGTDSHLYFGWYHGDVRDLGRARPRRCRALVRFVSEFGAQAVPDGRATSSIRRAGPTSTGTRSRERHGLRGRRDVRRRAARRVRRRSTRGGTATQAYQAELLRHHIETLRRLKYRPTGGFCLLVLNDPAPMISASVLDHERQPKLACQAVVEACRPVIVVTDRLPGRGRAGDQVALDVHVVNDLRSALVDATVSARAPGAAAVGSGPSGAMWTPTPWRSSATPGARAVPDEPGRSSLLGDRPDAPDDGSGAEITADPPRPAPASSRVGQRRAELGRRFLNFAFR